jgi:hypothetical protein
VDGAEELAEPDAVVDGDREHPDQIRCARPDDGGTQDPSREALDVDDETTVDDVVGVAAVDVGVVDDDASA